MRSKIRTLALAAMLLSSPVFAQAQNQPQSQDEKNLPVRQRIEELSQEMSLSAREKEILKSEVLAQPQFFVSSMSSASADLANPAHPVDASEVQISIDREKLRGFIGFNEKNLGVRNACVYSRPAKNCETCATRAAFYQAVLAERLTRRDFAVNTGASLSGEFMLSGERAADAYFARARESGCGIAIYNEVTSPEASETYIVGKNASGARVLLKNRAVLQPLQPGQQTSDMDRVKDAVGRQLADLYGAAFAKYADLAMAKAAAGAGDEERYFRVEGVGSFLTFVSVKNWLAKQFPMARFEERFIEAGSVRFALQGITPAEIASRVPEASIEGKKIPLRLTNSNEVVLQANVLEDR